MLVCGPDSAADEVDERPPVHSREGGQLDNRAFLRHRDGTIGDTF